MKNRLTTFTLLLCAAVLPLEPSRAHAQSTSWAVGPGLFLDPDFSTDGESGIALFMGVTLRADRPLSYTLDLLLARTDFPVGPYELHRNHGLITVGTGIHLFGERQSLVATLGVGALFWDDLNETDPAFGSSANAEETAVPGLELNVPLGELGEVKLFARDYITGWYQRILDPSEADLDHRLVLGVAAVFR